MATRPKVVVCWSGALDVEPHGTGLERGGCMPRASPGIALREYVSNGMAKLLPAHGVRRARDDQDEPTDSLDRRHLGLLIGVEGSGSGRRPKVGGRRPARRDE